MEENQVMGCTECCKSECNCETVKCKECGRTCCALIQLSDREYDPKNRVCCSCWMKMKGDKK